MGDFKDGQQIGKHVKLQYNKETTVNSYWYS